jgi:DNA repair protein RecN (Recombination protein N)
MLSQLSIINYALIENVEIRLKPGLTALTGETGSGKSILLGALGMLLGQRADHSALRDPDKKCIVEAVFLSNNPDIAQWLRKHDLDSEDEITLRREIASKGKSRAFINDTPVTLELIFILSMNPY